MKGKKFRAFIFMTALAGIMTVGGMMAYFTDADTVTNTFTVGKVSLDLQEPDWDPDEAKEMTPGKEIEKNPQIKNDGVNSSYVFMKVTVPYRNIVTANANGSKNAAADTELFSYQVNSGWTELEDAKKDASTNTVTHLYVYGTRQTCRELMKAEVTPALFERVKFANIVEDQSLEGTVQQIKIDAYGIQTTDIDGGKKAPADVWAVLERQAPAVDVSQKEDQRTDIKQ